MSEKRAVNWTNARTLAALTILVGTELVGASWAAGWALTGLFDLSSSIGRSLEVVFVVLGFIGLFYFVRTAMAHESIWR